MLNLLIHFLLIHRHDFQLQSAYGVASLSCLLRVWLEAYRTDLWSKWGAGFVFEEKIEDCEWICQGPV